MHSAELEYLVGVLAEDSYVLERTGGKAAIFVNSLQVVQFAVRPISRTPQALGSVKLFHGFSKDLERHGLLDDYAAPAEQRILCLRQFLQGQLLVFRPSQKGQYWNIVDVCPVVAPLAHQSDSSYLAVPILSQLADQLALPELLQRLRQQLPLPTIDRSFGSASPPPACIIWRESPQTVLPWQVIGSFVGLECTEGGCSFMPNGDLRVTPFQEVWESGVFLAPNEPHLLFVSEQVQALMREALAHAMPVAAGESSTSRSGELFAQSMARVAAPEPVDRECQLLSRWQQLTLADGLHYTKADLVNFHTAIKTSSLVILSGLSGTGKSRLIRSYGQALGLPREQWCFVAVRPAWTDDSDLLGFLDHAHSLYRASESGLLDTLIRAARDPEHLYLICLDEMNLARVEHYFSQLLSVLELPLPERRLRLYPDQLASRLYNALDYPPSVQLGDNLLLAGTVNLDESTYHFSDKVLDRANVIRLEVLPFAELFALPLAATPLPLVTETTAPLYASFRQNAGGPALSEREVELLWQIHLALREASPTLGVGYRVVLQINQYLQNLPRCSEFSRADALDRQLLQRVCPRIRGPEGQLRSLVAEFREEARGAGGLLGLLDQFADLGAFPLCRRALQQKGRDLTLHGYTV